jgi:hypothetical protein
LLDQQAPDIDGSLPLQTGKNAKAYRPKHPSVTEASAALGDRVQDVEQIAGRPGQPIESRHDQHALRRAIAG